MAVQKKGLAMPVKAKPYKHQQEAFDFCCGVFGLLRGGDAASPDGGGKGAALLMEM